MNDHDWRRDAACARPDVDPDWFFPAETATVTKSNYKLARAVCAECPVVEKCRMDADIFIEYAHLGLAEDSGYVERPVGIFGGESEKDRNGHRANKTRWYQENREKVNAERRARRAAKRAAESPEEREARLVKHRENNRAYEERRRVLT